ncbi:WG repeat-containing protein [Flammeovirga yaeyamensis]|uniref:WG repeat-containing protein n=1 Tax=Flammeovirga yaeyamensis TaxID=367791 RepID=A0AAX1N4E5_9BACT|nr:WG repeat-containing protein [Flammeovirga yaeyamensis]MBB3698631.1 hypothetical protein [Flammeovirga yaeyamensis]NMF34022.1 WG repeat-containing protein [Flammeovirga yaeyamensis]QWG01010.1 WG repeat-containing protein [Flammeovirga yaeyamensis]
MKLTLINYLLLSFFTISIAQAQEKLIPFKEGDLWGYKNQNKKVVISPQYQAVQTFKFNTAIVTDKQGKVGLINTEGDWELKPKYQEITNTLNEQVFIVQNQKSQKGVLHRVGKELIPFEYDSIFVFDNKNNYIVCKDDKYGIYNTDLEYWKLPLRYYQLAFDDNRILRVVEDDLMGFLEPESFAVISTPQVVMNKTRGGKKVVSFNFDQGSEETIVQTSAGFNILNKHGQLLLPKGINKKLKKIDIASYNANAYKIPSNAKYIVNDNVYLKTSKGQFEEKALETFKMYQVDPENPNIKRSDNGKYYLINDGKKVSKEYDSLFVYSHDFLQGWNYNKKKNKYDKSLVIADIMDENIGKEVAEGYQAMISYSTSEETDDYNWAIMVSANSQQGIFDLDTKKYVVDMDYDQINTRYLEKYNLLLIGNNEDNYAIYDVSINKQVTDMKYQPIIDSSTEDMGYLLFQRKGSQKESVKVLDFYSIKNKKITGRTIDGYQIRKRAKKGTLAVSKNTYGWETDLAFEVSEYAPQNYQYIYYKDHGKGNVGVGFLDKDLNVIIPADYASISFSGSKDNYLKVTDFDFNEGVIDMNGKTIVEFGKYKSIGLVSDGVLPVVNYDNQEQFIDLDSKNLTIKD